MIDLIAIRNLVRHDPLGLAHAVCFDLARVEARRTFERVDLAVVLLGERLGDRLLGRPSQERRRVSLRWNARATVERRCWLGVVENLSQQRRCLCPHDLARAGAGDAVPVEFRHDVESHVRRRSLPRLDRVTHERLVILSPLHGGRVHQVFLGQTIRVRADVEVAGIVVAGLAAAGVPVRCGHGLRAATVVDAAALSRRAESARLCKRNQRRVSCRNHARRSLRNLRVSATT